MPWPDANAPHKPNVSTPNRNGPNPHRPNPNEPHKLNGPQKMQSRIRTRSCYA